MNLKIGIVGLPNVGKSTLFNALVKGSKAEAANYPFCTIEPNVGVVEVPDERLKPLAEISHSQKIVPAVVEFVDIAGLVKDANKGEGLGNKFLAHIRECQAIAMVVRFFEDDRVTHVHSGIDPESDIETIETELQLADLQTLEKKILTTEKESKSGDKDSKARISEFNKLKEALDSGKNARDVELTDEEANLLSDLQLLTQKSVLYIANVSETQLQNKKSKIKNQNYNSKTKNSHSEQSEESQRSFANAQDDGERNDFIPISAKVEAELNELDDKEKAEYLEILGIKQSGLDNLIKEAYRSLGLITYFTSGEKETRAWTIKKDSTAPQAAGAIHTDFERGFIAADIVTYKDFVGNEGLPRTDSLVRGWSGARSHGLVRTEGKKYIFKDGDIALFKFNV